MSTNYPGAVDSINGTVNDAWITGVADALGYQAEMRWQNVSKEGIPDGSKFWGRTSIQTVFQEQTTLSNEVSGPDKKRYTASGLVFVQLFCPMSDSQSAEKAQAIVEIIKTAFRKKKSCVWFRNVRVNELPQENTSYRYNVVAEFEYDEIA